MTMPEQPPIPLSCQGSVSCWVIALWPESSAMNWPI